MQPTDYLSDLEKEKVHRFNEDTVLKEAVRKVLLAGIYMNGTLKKGAKANPLHNWALSFGATTPGVTDEQLGQNLRAHAWAVNSIESAFNKLGEIKVEQPEEKKEKKNPAL